MRADGVQKYQPGGVRCRPARHAANVRVRPKAGDRRRVRQRTRISAAPSPAHRARHVNARRRQKHRRQHHTLGAAACLTLAIVLRWPCCADVRCPARRDGGRRRRAERRSARSRNAHEPPLPRRRPRQPPTSARKALSTKIQLTEATTGYLEVGSPRTKLYARAHPRGGYIFQKHRARGRKTAGASLLLSVHGNSDPYSLIPGLGMLSAAAGNTHHEDSLRLAHLITDKFGAADQRLRGNAGVRYIYYAGDDESGYEKAGGGGGDSTVYSKQTFGLLEKTDCPAVHWWSSAVTSEG